MIFFRIPVFAFQDHPAPPDPSRPFAATQEQLSPEAEIGGTRRRHRGRPWLISSSAPSHSLNVQAAADKTTRASTGGGTSICGTSYSCDPPLLCSPPQLFLLHLSRQRRKRPSLRRRKSACRHRQHPWRDRGTAP